MKQKADMLQGTLALMVLKTLDVLGPQHGYGIARRIEQISGDLLSVNLRSSSNTAPRSRARKVLMGVEVGLATVVLIAAALFLQSFRSARQTDPRFRPEGVLLAAYDLSGRNPDDTSEREFAARLLERLHSLPDVEAAAITTNVPLGAHGSRPGYSHFQHCHARILQSNGYPAS